MNPPRTAAFVLCAVTLAFFASAPALAAEPLPQQREQTPFHADLEVDPTAYVLKGYSVHAGLGYKRLRVDLGAFGLEVPRAIHGNDGFTASFRGYGAKLQLFPFAEQRGLFVGVDAAVAHVSIERDDTAQSVRQTQINLGAHVGTRVALPAGFYVSPWIGLGRAFGARDVTMGDATYKSSALVVFPAVHVGYSFL